MKLLDFVSDETDLKRSQLLIACGLAGVGAGMVVTLVNTAVANGNNHWLRMGLLALYLVMLAMFTFGERRALRMTHIAVENALHKIKVRMTQKVLAVDLRFIESHSHGGHFAPMLQDTSLISDGVVMLVYAIQAVCLLISSGVFMAWKTPVTFFLALAVLALALPKFIRNFHLTAKESGLAAKKETAFFNLFSEAVNGFKEVKLNRVRRQAILQDMVQLAKKAETPRHVSNLRLVNDMLFFNSIFYVLLGALVFVLPEYWPTQADGVQQSLTTILFIMGPVNMLSNIVPNLAKVEAAVKNLYALEANLDKQVRKVQASNGADKPSALPAKASFTSLRLTDLEFAYQDAAGEATFRSGPHNVEFKPGELVFIVGGNGAGKSTLLKLLTGLYAPQAGEILLDGDLVDGEARQAYRELFAIVFTDFHLFDRLYGLEDVPPEEVRAWLKDMGLDRKTRYVDGRFTNLNLSTGQRKRLAFIVAVLKRRPICILDEVAADQDPDFRRRFYEELLPKLKQQGTCVIVVSHDDRYFHCADRVIHIQDGCIVD